jgi:hypothetical protein
MKMQKIKSVLHLIMSVIVLCTTPSCMAITPGQAGNISQLIADIKAGRVKEKEARERAKEVSLRMAPGSAILNELTEVAEHAKIPDILGKNSVPVKIEEQKTGTTATSAAAAKESPVPAKVTGTIVAESKDTGETKGVQQPVAAGKTSEQKKEVTVGAPAASVTVATPTPAVVEVKKPAVTVGKDLFTPESPTPVVVPAKTEVVKQSVVEQKAKIEPPTPVVVVPAKTDVIIKPETATAEVKPKPTPVKAADPAYGGHGKGEKSEVVKQAAETKKATVETSSVELPVIEEVPEEKRAVPHTLLIFLDDIEKKLDSVSVNLSAALLQEAGPIIASALPISCIARTDTISKAEASKPLVEEHDTLVAKLKAQKISVKHNEEVIRMRENMTALAFSFDTEEAKKWIIKEISPLLYLFVPKKYLQAQHIADTDVAHFVGPYAPITETEQALGLKVNHMKTVALAAIKKPEPVLEASGYFVALLQTIFVTNGEYASTHKNLIPAWAFFMLGHGFMNHSIVGLPLEKFKQCLEFFDTKINTKLFFYISCYAAGMNAKTIYENNTTGMADTYPFTIIMQALTDTKVSGVQSGIDIENGILGVDLRNEYIDFVQMVTTPDVIDYHALVEPFMLDVPEAKLKSLCQIKFPGLPWFSVIESDKVVSIGSIMAKTRTTPLDIAQFFKKGGIPASPLGILLYTQHVPFTLVVNTTDAGRHYVPAFVSMIAGDAVHHIKKISSTNNTTDDIVNAFYLKGLTSHKVFVIEEIEARLSAPTARTFGVAESSVGVLQHVVIDYVKPRFNVYCTYNNEIYTVMGKLTAPSGLVKAGDKEKERYLFLSKQYGLTAESSAIPGTSAGGIETRSVHQLVTPGAVAEINKAVEKNKDLQKQEKAAVQK